MTETPDQMGWAFYSGDVTNIILQTGIQDGLIEHHDYTTVEDAMSLTYLGYVIEDITGDGIVESADYMLIENNSYYAIVLIRP